MIADDDQSLIGYFVCQSRNEGITLRQLMQSNVHISINTTLPRRSASRKGRSVFSQTVFCQFRRFTQIGQIGVEAGALSIVGAIGVGSARSVGAGSRVVLIRAGGRPDRHGARPQNDRRQQQNHPPHVSPFPFGYAKDNANA